MYTELFEDPDNIKLIIKLTLVVATVAFTHLLPIVVYSISLINEYSSGKSEIDNSLVYLLMILNGVRLILAMYFRKDLFTSVSLAALSLFSELLILGEEPNKKVLYFMNLIPTVFSLFRYL